MGEFSTGAQVDAAHSCPNAAIHRETSRPHLRYPPCGSIRLSLRIYAFDPKKLTQNPSFGLISLSARVEAQAFISIVFVDGRSDTKSGKGAFAEVAFSLPENAPGPAR